MLLWNDIIKVLLNYYNLDYFKENVYISYIFINKDIWNLKLLDNYLGERWRQNKMAESSQKYALNIRSHTDTYTGFYYRTAWVLECLKNIIDLLHSERHILRSPVDAQSHWHQFLCILSFLVYTIIN